MADQAKESPELLGIIENMACYFNSLAEKRKTMPEHEWQWLVIEEVVGDSGLLGDLLASSVEVELSKLEDAVCRARRHLKLANSPADTDRAAERLREAVELRNQKRHEREQSSERLARLRDEYVECRAYVARRARVR